MDEGDGLKMSWADLFLALFYAATLFLLFAWIRGCELPNVPTPLAIIVGKFYSWIVAGIASAVVSAILRERLSWLVLVWTVLVTGFLVFSLKCQPPKPPAPAPDVEIWEESEGGRPLIVWHVDYSGSFPCPPNVGIAATCKASRNGTQRSVTRFQSSDGNHCQFVGTVSGKTIDGTYHCDFGMTGGVAPWTATIVTDK
jgi:hypothetical protein